MAPLWAVPCGLGGRELVNVLGNVCFSRNEKDVAEEEKEENGPLESPRFVRLPTARTQTPAATLARKNM